MHPRLVSLFDSRAGQRAARPDHPRRYHRLAALGGVFLLLATLVPSGPANATERHRRHPHRSGREIVWRPSRLVADVEAGGATTVDVTLHVRRPLKNVRLEASKSLRAVVDMPDMPEGIVAPGKRPLTLVVGSPLGKRQRRISGSIRLRRGRHTIGKPLHVSIRVKPPAPGAALDRVLRASPARLVDTPVGQVVVDEILVAPNPSVSEPLQVVQEIARRHGAVVIGSAQEPGIYQLRIPELRSLAALRSAWKELEAENDVAFAGPRLLTQLSEESYPDDREWDDWQADGGNNWHLKAIAAPEAWNDETGSDDVTVAIIDVDFDRSHEDLDFTSVTGDRVAGVGHGTHVAGTACADGNNGLGVSGVAWRCDLRGYEVGAGGSSIDSLLAAQSMVAAARDNADVVNMSFGLNACEEIVTNPVIRDIAEGNERLYRFAVAQAETLHEPLWVTSAGNADCGLDVIPPANLSSAFPRTFMSVAATNMDGELSNFSNHGPATTSVAAPGGQASERSFLWFGLGAESIFSTLPASCSFVVWFCGSRYGDMAGTSMAAPQVTGTAALLFSARPALTAAQAKQCLVRSTKDGRQITGHPFNEIDVSSAVRCAKSVGDGPVLDLPAEVDVVFAIDLTGSMGGVLSTVKAQASDVVENLRNLAPDTDFRFGVTSFEDYEGFFDSRACGSNYAATYGSSGDVPFEVAQPLTADTDNVGGVVADLQLGSGDDSPESYARALWELAQDDNDLGYRGEALKLVVMFGDDLPHDQNLHRGFPDDGPLPDIPVDTGIDPGRDGQIDCGDGDIEFYNDALGALESRDIRLLFVNNAFSDAYAEAWNFWASVTGGASVRIAPDGSVGDGGLPALVAELIAASGR